MICKYEIIVVYSQKLNYIMGLDLKKLREPLDINDLDFRIQSISPKGLATILPYKNARVDMDRLDDVVGAENWQRIHSNENANCTISIWNYETSQWVHKEDTGTESMAEKEKGLASDSFKRAGFNWGIGRELYKYPIIKVWLSQDANEFFMAGDKAKQGWGLNLKEWTWDIGWKDGDVVSLTGKDGSGKVRFTYPQNKKPDSEPAKKTTNKKPKRLTKKQKEGMLKWTKDNLENFKTVLTTYALDDKEKEWINAQIKKFSK